MSEQEISLGEVAAAGGGKEVFTGMAMPREELVALLRRVADLVEGGDSFEGLVNWLLPQPGDPAGTYARVEARYRVGDGLGGEPGFELVGEWVDENKRVKRHMSPGQPRSRKGK